MGRQKPTTSNDKDDVLRFGWEYLASHGFDVVAGRVAVVQTWKYGLEVHVSIVAPVAVDRQLEMCLVKNVDLPVFRGVVEGLA